VSGRVSAERRFHNVSPPCPVDLTSRRVVPFLNDVRDGIAEAGRLHERLPVPEWCGRSIVSSRTASSA
jgi:hypothetical protein